MAPRLREEAHISVGSLGQKAVFHHAFCPRMPPSSPPFSLAPCQSSAPCHTNRVASTKQLTSELRL